jgi:hypothetical protein
VCIRGRRRQSRRHPRGPHSSRAYQLSVAADQPGPQRPVPGVVGEHDIESEQPRDARYPRIDPRSGVGRPSRPGLGMCDADGDHERPRPRRMLFTLLSVRRPSSRYPAPRTSARESASAGPDHAGTHQHPAAADRHEVRLRGPLSSRSGREPKAWDLWSPLDSGDRICFIQLNGLQPIGLARWTGTTQKERT